MNKLKIPHNGFVFVCDGRKALFLRNEGDEKFPNLKTESVFEDENRLTHEQGSERPGRVSKALDSGQRSAVETVAGIRSKNTGLQEKSRLQWKR